jgi:hypothetical protein
MNQHAVEAYWSVIGFQIPTMSKDTTVHASVTLSVAEYVMDSNFTAHKVQAFNEVQDFACSEIEKKYVYTYHFDAFFGVKKNDASVTFNISELVNEAIAKGETEINLQIGYVGSTGKTTKFHSRSANVAALRPTLKLEYEPCECQQFTKKSYSIPSAKDVVVWGDNYGKCRWEHKEYLAIMNQNAVECYWSVIGFQIPTNLTNTIVQASVSLTVSQYGLESFIGVHKVPAFKETMDLSCRNLDTIYSQTFTKMDAYAKVEKSSPVVTFEISELVNAAIANKESEVNLHIRIQGSDGVTTRFYSRDSEIVKNRPTLNIVVMEAVSNNRDATGSAVQNLSGANLASIAPKTATFFSLVVAALVYFAL